jgi:hypothetical protein
MISGITNDLPTSVTSMTIAGTLMTKAQILSQLDGIETTLDMVSSTKTAYTEAVAARKAAMAADRTFYENVVMAVKQQLGASPSQLAAFGINPPKVKAKLSATALAISKAKAAATRALRGTKGKKQKAAITLTGQATVEVLGPDGQPLIPSASSGSAPVTPAAPAAPAAPAPAAAPAAPAVPVAPAH